MNVKKTEKRNWKYATYPGKEEFVSYDRDGIVPPRITPNGIGNLKTEKVWQDGRAAKLEKLS